MKTQNSLQIKLKNLFYISEIRKEKIPIKPNKEKCITKAQNFLLKENITQIPIQFEEIYKNHGWILCSYEEAKHILKTTDPLNINKVNAEARTAYHRLLKTFVTVYREDVKIKGRIYFTLGHELGHIILNHLTSFENTALNRGGLTKKDYGVLEYEAEFFSSEFIMPMILVKAIEPKEPQDIIRVFKVTNKAAVNKLKDLNWHGNESMYCKNDELLSIQFNNFLKYISVCIPSYKIPSNFTVKKQKEVEYMNIKLSYVETDEDGRFKKCPRCGNESISRDARYCKMCGLYLYNSCTKTDKKIADEGCGKINAGDARYCEYCGAETVLMRNGLLLSWEELLKLQEEVAVGKDNDNHKKAYIAAEKGNKKTDDKDFLIIDELSEVPRK